MKKRTDTVKIRLRAAPFECAEDRNAEYFVARHGHDLRWHTQFHRWMQWDRTHRYWRALPEPPYNLVSEAMRHFAKMEIDEDHPDQKIVNWFMRSRTQRAMQSCLLLARADSTLHVTTDHWNRNPNLLAVANGVVNLETGRRQEHQRDDYMSMRCPHPYDPKAKCPRWERFLKEVFPKHTDILVPWIQKAIGYSFTGLTDERCLFIPYGSGANGKTTLLNTVSYVLGGPSMMRKDWESLPPLHPGYAHVLAFAALQKGRFGGDQYALASLPGRRFVSLAEAEKEARFNEASIKRWTGGDAVQTRGIYQEPITFVPSAKFWLAVNHLPGTDDHSDAFRDRVRVVPFLQRFDRHPALQQSLYDEASGILTWAVRGARQWYTEGLGESDQVRLATKKYFRRQNPLDDFLRTETQKREGAVTLLQVLYARYEMWANTEHLTRPSRWDPESRLGRIAFSDKLEELGYRKVHRAGPNRDQVGFEGLLCR